MSTIPVFAPLHPAPATTIADQLRINACCMYVWQLLVTPTNPIVQERTTFEIQLPNVPHTIYARLGALVMHDPNLFVFQLIADYPGAPPLIAITRTHDETLGGFTQLVPAIYTDPGITFVYLG
jgi:hypothetical protein